MAGLAEAPGRSRKNTTPENPHCRQQDKDLQRFDDVVIQGTTFHYNDSGLMFRIIFYLLCTVFLISFLRGVIGVIGKGLSALFGTPPPQQRRQPAGGPVPLTGELRRDPVCGTSIATSTSITHTAGAETFYFCSTACRDKFLAR